ncbi:hypothetical protein HU200_048627 [Digitaria exilis]|uniref:laccase n=1 Tax=Digitaria exilis TaxID=1010633 RepID=A0A835AXD5_9POAL|nr:hypothetical protein HU200_048627 [Digitaria exilis]
MITQCPIRPGHNFTYRFNITGQQGTLWWHAHVASLRASVHGALIIRPRQGATSYPFPKHHREIPIIIGEWWETDLVQMAGNMTDGYFGFNPVAATLNGKLGDLYNCSGAMEEGYVLEVEPGKTYLLRFINAVLTSEHYLKIAGHKLTVVAADANYVNPYTTDTVAIAPGQTLDALLVADAPPRRSYYMVSMGSQPTIANPPPPVIVTRGTVQYRSSSSDDHEPAGNGVPLPSMVPDMPDLHDTATSFYFHGNLTSLHKSRVPTRVDEHLLIVLSAGSICRRGHRSCKRSGDMESNVLVTMNISFELPAAAAAAVTPLLESHYYHRNEPVYVTLPDRPQRAFNFTDHALIPFGPKEAALEPTGKATTARRFRHGMAWHGCGGGVPEHGRFAE